MRSSVLLLVGLSLLGGGVAVLLSAAPGLGWLGVVLIVVGVLVKLGGFLVTGAPSPSRSRRGSHATTLDGQRAEVPRAGLPSGRSQAVRRGVAPGSASAHRRPSPAIPPAARRAS